jgi:hypothetical protein
MNTDCVTSISNVRIYQITRGCIAAYCNSVSYSVGNQQLDVACLPTERSMSDTRYVSHPPSEPWNGPECRGRIPIAFPVKIITAHGRRRCRSPLFSSCPALPLPHNYKILLGKLFMLQGVTSLLPLKIFKCFLYHNFLL